jgi:parallel beta-helix repeat protein
MGFISTSSSDRNVTFSSTLDLNASAESINNESIYFLSDDDLDDYAFPGNGSAEDPWRFENYTLEYSFNSSTVGIHVENITEHLIIRNLTLTNTNDSVRGTGIEILANNVVIENVIINNVYNGIHLEGDNLSVNYTVIDAQNRGIKMVDCTSNSITQTNVTQSNYGILLEFCNQTLLEDNIFSNGITGVQIYDSTNFRLDGNYIGQYAYTGLIIVESSPKTGDLSIVTNNIFFQNEQHVTVVSESVNVQFYDHITEIGNFWDDWRGWGKYTVQDSIFDLYPLGNDLEVAPHYPFKFWFWIFAPTIIVLGAGAYFFYWKLVIQPTKE